MQAGLSINQYYHQDS
uniref:Uncharacterized protein n=1 Tax=Arundo donax TaxID=35708 RepID=A0A0A8ZKT9_ARUDO